MQHLKLRCKHCQKEYTYCTYGNGPEFGTEEGCSMDYCAECQKAIDEALEKIEVKFCPKFKEIKDATLFIPLFREIKNGAESRFLNGKGGLTAMQIYASGEYDNIDEYTHSGITYRVEYNDDTPEDVHVSIETEYDLRNKIFTGKPWLTDKEDGYRHGRCSGKLLRNFMNLANTSAMPEPTGTIAHLTLPWEWDVITPKKEKQAATHRSFNYRTNQIGAVIKCDIKEGYGIEKKRVLIEDLDVDGLVDFVRYEFTVEGYDDERFVHFKDFKVL